MGAIICGDSVSEMLLFEVLTVLSTWRFDLAILKAFPSYICVWAKKWAECVGKEDTLIRIATESMVLL